ncbi:MAG: type I-E CRISPR-associated protein Cas6/Cse3/CasE [Candidatus Lokiarchaeota archaeon]
MGLYNENDQYQWLNRKGELGGFNLSHILISRKEEITAKKPRNSKKMTFIGVEFQGILRVNKPKKFIETLKKGIGSGKAFGFGFLTISKI